MENCWCSRSMPRCWPDWQSPASETAICADHATDLTSANFTGELFRGRVLAEQRHRLLHRRYELGGEDDGGVLFNRDLRDGLQRPELECDGVLGDDIGGLA